MKLTDFALIFVAIFLPIVIIVYVNTSFVVKAEKQEMYYKNIMNSAINDAVSSMKQVENSDLDIDYGYSGIIDNKVSINSNIAIDTFYNSLANNFNIANNETALTRLKMYIPVIAILDYDGIYIHSVEEDESGQISFVTKPKVNYTYTYVITEGSQGVNIDSENYDVKPLKDLSTLPTSRLLGNHIYQITFTMDDYVYLDVFNINRTTSKVTNIVVSKKFYLSDSQNNHSLVYDEFGVILMQDKIELAAKIAKFLENKRQNTIAQIGMEEISYAVNKHNHYAKSAGINYTFRFSVDSDAAWIDTMDGIGMIALIQGISLGNRQLNYKAYSTSDLILTKKYYASNALTSEEQALSYLGQNLYHISTKCNAYKQYINNKKENDATKYYYSRAEAATHGYYPCPICKP